MFYRKNEIEIRYNNEKLKYQKPEILQAPYFRDIDEQKKIQKKLRDKKFEFKYGSRRTASGYANIGETASKKKFLLCII